jgi:CubicO group peptidase (beta-lactamase class C family)
VAALDAVARMLLGGGAPVLSAEAAHSMTTDQLTSEQKAHGGLGPDFFTGRSWGFCQAVLDSGVFGWDGGFGTSWMVDPNRDLIVIVLTQRMFESPEPPQVHRDIRSAAYAALA